jgi:hypothetical protein
VDESALESCPPSERKRLKALGAIVVAIACISGTSGTFLVHEFLHAPLIVALPLGAGWGAIVLTLDRWMIASIRRQRSLGMTVSLALSRVLLAVALGLVTAPPILLRIFQAETVALGTQEKQTALLGGKHKLAARFTTIPQLEAKSADLEQQVGNGNSEAGLADNATYGEATKKAAQLRSEATAATARALCEADGTCGTHRAGNGPDYRLKEHVAQRVTAEAQAAEAQAAQLRATLLREQATSAGERQARAHKELASVEGLLRTQRRERAQQESILQHAYSQPLGLADRLDALSNLAASHASVGWWNWVLAIIIVLLDTSPALGKLVMILGEPTPYEFQVGQEERLHREASEVFLDAERRKTHIDAESDVEYAERVRRLRAKHFEAVADDQVKAEATERRRWLKFKLAHMRKRMDEQIRREFGEPEVGDRSGAARKETQRRWRGFGRRGDGHSG